MMMSTAHVSPGSHWNYIMLNQHCPSLALRKLVLPLSAYPPPTYTLRKDDSTFHHRHVSHLGSTLEMTMMQVTQGVRVTELLPLPATQWYG